MQRIALMAAKPCPSRRMVRELGSYFLRATSSGDGELGRQLWPQKYEDLSLVLRAYIKNPDVVVCTYNSNTRETETGRSLILTSIR